MINIENDTNELLTEVQTHLEKITKEGKEETFHKLRIGIKKLNAVTNMINFCYGGKKKLDNENLVDLFKHAGKIRELQLMVKQLDEHIKSTDKNTIADKLNGQISRSIKKFTSLYIGREGKDFKQTRKLIKYKLGKKNIHQQQEYFLMINEKVFNSSLRLTGNKEQAHLLRKDIKELKYNLKAYKGNRNFNIIHEELLDKWETLLGNWHDTDKIRGKLENIEVKKGDALHHELLKMKVDFRKKERALLKEAKNQIETDLIDFLHKDGIDNFKKLFGPEAILAFK